MPEANRPPVAPPPAAHTAAIAACLLAAATWAAGCKNDEVRSYDAPKAPAAQQGSALPAAVPASAEAPAPSAAAAEKPADAGKPKEDRVVTVGSIKAMVPGAWEQDPKPRMMREATFLVGDPAKKTEVIVTKLNGPAGGMLENVNRWRGQVGLPPVAAVNEAEIPKVKVGGKDAMVFDLAGPPDKPTKRQVQAVAQRDDGTYYIKIIGDAELVGQQKAAFDRFLASIEFGK